MLPSEELSVLHFLHSVGRAVAQAVSRWLPIAAARVRSRAGLWGFVVDKTALRQFFSEYFGFPCQSFSTNFPIMVIIRGWLNRPVGGRSAQRNQLESPPHYTN
jgi:hypothetical protein